MNFPKFLRTPVFTGTRPVAASAVRRNAKHKKDETMTIERKENCKKSKRKRVNHFNIYIVLFAFLSSTVEIGRW